MRNKKIIIALVALLSTSTILVACVVGYKVFQFLQDNEIEMSMDSEAVPAKENVVETGKEQAETVSVEETKQLEDVENVARGDATGKDLSQKTEETSASEITSASEKSADTIEQSEGVAKENKDKVKKSGIYLDKSGITKNSDGSYSFSESYIEDVKKIQGMEKFNDQEINEILNGIGEFIIKYSDNIAQSFIEKEMAFYEPSGAPESNNGQLAVDTKPDPPVQNATPVEPEVPSNSGQQAVAVGSGETLDDWFKQQSEKNKNLTAADVGITDTSERMDWSDN